MKAKKVITLSIGILLLLGVIATVGFLSFTGMLLITPSIVIASASFFFAVAIEGEVYKQNILNGLKKILTRDYIKRKIIERELDTLIANDENLKQSQFLQDYKAQKKYFNKLRAQHLDKKLIQQQEKRLKYMQAYFNDFIFARNQNSHDELAKQLHKLVSVESQQKIQSEISKKETFSKYMWIFYSLAGVSCTFASIYSIHAGFLTLMTTFGFALAPTILLGGIIPLAIMAGIGYAILLYHNVSDMICNDTLQKWGKKIINYFQFREGQESRATYILRISGVGLLAAIVVGLGIFATIATAGTWWIAAKEGAKLIPYVAKFANWIRNITIPAMAIPNLLFNINNSFSTIKKLSQFSIKNKILSITNEINQTIKNENLLQLINPFRILIKLVEFPVKLFTFLAHLVSICVMSDHLDPIPPTITASLNCANEALVDGHFFMEDDHANKDLPDHQHNTKNHQHHKQNHDEEHNHQHGTMIDTALKIILSPLYFCNALWSYGFRSNKTSDFIVVLKETFGIEQQTNPIRQGAAPAISKLWTQQELVMKLDKQISYYDEKNIYVGKKIAHEKQSIFINLKNRVNTFNLSTASSKTKIESQTFHQFFSHELTKEHNGKLVKDILSTHRIGFFQAQKKQAHSQELFDDLLNTEEYNSVLVS